ncbi:MAG TPA: sigma-70 family RNA polymerase sigma factor [Bacilli bacterium]|nr:sigma-70 family RNA polymerase sigma factor [Bacilli bacterium]
MEDKWADLALQAQAQMTLPSGEQDSTYLLTLLDEFENLIQGACRRYYNNPTERSDLLQESYIGFLKAVQTFNAGIGVTFAAYAKSKTEQAVWQAVRVHNRNRTREQADTAGSSDDGTRTSLLDSLPAPETDAAFSELEWRSLITSLSEREALVIEKVVVHGLSLAELARQEGVSPGTVKTWKQRAFLKIREELLRLRNDK